MLTNILPILYFSCKSRVFILYRVSLARVNCNLWLFAGCFDLRESGRKFILQESDFYVTFLIRHLPYTF